MQIDALQPDRTRANSGRPGLRQKLKQATAAAHRSLDAQFHHFQLSEIDGYRRFLEASAAALLPLEAALEEAGVQRLFPDWPERSRSAAIRADLDRIGGVVHPLRRVGPLNRNTTLGVMYVLEGSRLGAKFLLRSIAGNPQLDGATRYLGHGADKALWPGFLLRLESERATPADEADILLGAHRAFAMFAVAAARA